MPEDPSRSPSSRRHDVAPGLAGATPAADRLVARVASLLARTPRGGATTHEPDALAEAFLEECSRRFPVRGWIAARGGESGGARWLPAVEGPVPLGIADEPGSLLGNALQHRHPSVVHAIEALPELPERPYLVRHGGAWSFLPVVVCGRPVACLILRAPRSEALTPESLGEIREALPSLGMALHASDLQRRVDGGEGRNSEIATLFEFGRAMAWVLSADDMFRLLAESLDAVKWEVLALTTLEPGRALCRVRHVPGVSDGLLGAFTGAIHDEVTRQRSAPDDGSTFTVERVEGAGREGSRRRAAGRLGSTIHLPLRVRQRFAGMISLGALEARAWDPPSTRLLQAIASQASLTLDRLTAASEAERSKVGSMLESMSDGVVLLDRRLRVMLSNRAAAAHLEELTGQGPVTTLERLGETDLQTLMERFALGQPGPAGFEAVPAEGRIFTVTCSPVVDASGDAEGMVIVISDVSEDRRIQAQLAQSEKLSALGAFASGVAHELNNPLASVLGNAELLREAEVAPDVGRKVEAIAREADRCRKIVESLLRFVRGSPPVRRPLDLNTIIDDVIARLGAALASDGIEVADERDGTLLPVSGDEHFLGQVLYNIVNNARHAMAGAPTPRRLTLRARRDPGTCVIECSDTGPGIPPDRIGRIFDPFFTTKRVGQGTGLGLSLAYGTVLQHGGALRVASPPGEGATFTVELPALPPGTPEAGEVPVPQAPRAARRGEGRRILVVEDEAALAEVIGEFLEACGYLVDIAHDVRTALQRAEREVYDAILSDMKMPDMSGKDLHARVRALSPELARRIIFSTGDSANPETLDFFEDVGNRWLTKPFTLEQLIEAVESVIGPAGDDRLRA